MRQSHKMKLTLHSKVKWRTFAYLRAITGISALAQAEQSTVKKVSLALLSTMHIHKTCLYVGGGLFIGPGHPELK